MRIELTITRLGMRWLYAKSLILAVISLGEKLGKFGGLLDMQGELSIR